MRYVVILLLFLPASALAQKVLLDTVAVEDGHLEYVWTGSWKNGDLEIQTSREDGYIIAAIYAKPKSFAVIVSGKGDLKIITTTVKRAEVGALLQKGDRLTIRQKKPPKIQFN